MLLEAQPPVTIEIISPIMPVQDLFGLALIEIKVKNQRDSTIKISDANYLYFSAKVDSSDNWVTFSAKNLVFSSGPSLIYLKGNDYRYFKTNLNIFDIFKEYEGQYAIPLLLDKPHNIKIRACITSGTIPRKFCSDEVIVSTRAINGTDMAAFAYIVKNGHDPFRFTSMACMDGSYPVKSDIADSLSLHYPTSTFKMLADLSIAHEKAGLKEVPDALKPEIRQLLEKPLASPYTYVRYLAEALRKRLQ